ncbi:response regulator [Lichenicoccus roseus]|uniref:Response regulator n=1 Tax=Lichenicoccus roseus TaxID=2683649 RepID=A0A5R9J481_9PROT|nr:response regulator [Lichenicoccus roseus]TLU72430.1 response regulator [Lichenicoccus roseus]
MATTRRDDLIRALPYARRYARALTGSQPRGDLLVAESLRELLSAPTDDRTARQGLYKWVTRRFEMGLVDPGAVEEGLTARQRQLLLLTSLEEVPIEEAAPIVGLEVTEAGAQLAHARERLRASAATDVLIIEDEPIIAMDIEELVLSCGHRVVGVASTEADAVKIAQKTRPGLILADINLGLGGDGTSAVSRILKHHYAPVIFVTAYPERLLTGETVEPAFVITKPFEPLTLAIATYQAVTGGLSLK